LAGLATMPRGVSEDRLRRDPYPLVLERASREPGSDPLRRRQVLYCDLDARGLTPDRRSAGLAAMPGEVSDCSPRLLR
jgi:hypothetical protein